MGGTQYHLYHGEMLTLAEIAARSHRSKSTLIYRMRNYHVSAEEAADRDWDNVERFQWTDGRMLTMEEISEITGIQPSTIRMRLRRGVPFMDACTLKNCRGRDYGLDVVPRLSEEELYMLDGEVNQRAAKAICREMLGTDPRKVNLREWNYWIYRFDTDGIAFEILIRRDVATCTGRLKESGLTLIERKYRISDDKIKEVTYDG